MKLLLPAVVLSAAILTGCQSHPKQTNANSAGATRNSGSYTTTSASPDRTATLYVQGMACPLCANNIDDQLMRIKGVEQVTVDLGTGKVLAKLSPDNPPSQDELAAAIERSGFTLDRIEMPSSQRSAP